MKIKINKENQIKKGRIKWTLSKLNIVAIIKS
jgi:hypothetical protein